MNNSYESGRFKFTGFDEDLQGNINIENTKYGEKFSISGKALRDFVAFCFVVPKKTQRLKDAEDSYDILIGT